MAIIVFVQIILNHWEELKVIISKISEMLDMEPLVESIWNDPCSFDFDITGVDCIWFW